MKQGKFGRLSLSDCLSDIITNALPYESDAEKAYSDSFTESKKFSEMLHALVNEVADHVDANTSDLQKLITD